LTADIKMFQMVDEGGGDLAPFEAGAHIDIMTGNGLRRSYSLANDPGERGRYVTAILRESAGGGGSAWMHDELSVGDSLTVKPPINNFPLDESAAEHILIAGGIGITPILAMGYRLGDLGAKAKLHYCTKSPEETAFRDLVSEVFGPENVVFWHDGGDPSKGIVLNEVLGEAPEGAHLYLCGPAGLIDAAKAATEHWPAGNVHFELFGLAENEGEAPAAADEPFEIELKKSGKTLAVGADETILAAMADAGIEADSACEQGLCGTCEVALLAGEADHRDQLMNDEQKAANDKIFICISRAKPGEKLIIDL
jgi:ferredoxin-NADP reductase